MFERQLLKNHVNELSSQPRASTVASSVSARSWPLSRTHGLLSYAKSYVVILILFLFIQGNGLFSVAPEHAVGSIDAEQNSTLALLNAFVCFMTACLVFRTSPRVIKSLVSAPLLLCFVILAPISSIWSGVGLITLRHAIVLDIEIVFSLWFLDTYSIEEQETLLLSTGVFVALSSLALALFLPRYGIMGGGEWKGIFWHKNQLAQAMELLFSPLLFRRIGSGSGMAGTVSMAILGVCLMGFSQARTGIVLTLMIVGLALFARVVRSTPRFRVFIYYLAAVFLSMGLPALYIARDSVLALLGKSPDLTGRLDTWPILIPFIFKHPLLGYGYSGFWTGYSGDSGTALSGMSGPMNTADNGYIDIALQFGLVGLLILFAFLLKALGDFVEISKWTKVPLSAFWYLAFVLDAVLGNVSGTFFFDASGISTITLVLGCVGLSQLLKAGRLSVALEKSDADQLVRSHIG